MSVLASDDFNRSNGALGANWASINGAAIFAAMTIVSNQASSPTDPNGNRYTAISWPNDQYSQATITGPSNVETDGPGVAIRIASAADTVYFCQMDVIANRIYKVVTGTFTQVKVDVVGGAAGSILYFEAQGTTLLAKKNGANLFGGGFTDSAIASGQAGIAGSGDPNTVTLDDWSGGDFAAAAVTQYVTGIFLQSVNRGATF